MKTPAKLKTSIYLRAIFVILVFCIISPNLWAWELQWNGNSIKITSFVAKGRTYNIVAIRAHGTFESEAHGIDTRVKNYAESASYIPNILRAVQTWIIEQYISQGRIVRGSSLHKAMETTESLLDGRSSIVFITEENNLDKIKAVLRVTHISKRWPKHPLEMRLKEEGIEFAIPEVMVPSERYEKVGDTYRVTSNPTEGLYEKVGDTYKPINYDEIHDTVELKNFIRVANSSIDFIPMLFRSAEMEMFFDQGRYYPVLDRRDFRYRQLRPDKWILECDSKMVSYYQYLGFKLLHSFPAVDSFVMQLGAPDFPKMAAIVDSRVGQKIVQDNRIRTYLNFTPVDFAKADCGGILSFRKTYFRE